jgi:glycerol-3-phosphate dehydrogenase (NAD(P)+)
LITRGLHEMTKLAVALGGRIETLAGLAGMGDLVLTCTGSLSRNRSVGVALGRGKPLAEILAESRTVAEGVRTSKAAKELAERHGIDMPITAEMYRVLHEGESPRVALQRLMTRSLKSEMTR